MTATEPRGGEPRADDTATPPRYNHPTARVHHHTDDRGPFLVAVCSCGWVSREFADPSDAESAKARHDMAHEDELAAAS